MEENSWTFREIMRNHNRISKDLETHTYIIQLRRDVNMICNYLFQTFDFNYKMLVLKEAEKTTAFSSYFTVIFVILGCYNKPP